VAKTKTQAEQTYEAINRLMDEGMSMADAVRRLAKEQGKQENAVRGNYYNHRRKLEGTSSAPIRRPRRSPPVSVDDAVAEAKRLLQQAVATIDQEVDDAKRALDTAKGRYDEVVASVKTRKEELERKIAAL
jgi:uncharacterized protein YoaH (UPF0181 family)